MKENEAIAKRALAVLSIPHGDLPDVPPCRFEIVKKDQTTYVFDIAHNPDGMEKLFQKLRATFPNSHFSVIFSMSASKDISTTVNIIKRHTQSIFPYDNGHPRLLRKSQIEHFIGKTTREPFDHFLTQAKIRADIIVITGSAYIMKELKTLEFSAYS